MEMEPTTPGKMRVLIIGAGPAGILMAQVLKKVQNTPPPAQIPHSLTAPPKPGRNLGYSLRTRRLIHRAPPRLEFWHLLGTIPTRGVSTVRNHGAFAGGSDGWRIQAERGGSAPDFQRYHRGDAPADSSSFCDEIQKEGVVGFDWRGG